MIALPSRRVVYLLVALVCAGLIGFALYLQYVEGEEPCPLCIFQRVVVIAMGIVFLVAAIHGPGARGARRYAVVLVLLGLAGVALAARHLWLQNLPRDQVPECGMGLNYMLETLPFTDVLSRVLRGTGECAEKGWTFLGLTIPGWTLLFFIGLSLIAVLNARERIR